MDTFLALAGELPRQSLETGDVLIAEGTTPDALWVLLDGELRVERDGVQVATIAERGACIGELSRLLGMPATTNVVATAPSVVVALHYAARTLEQHPQLALALARLLATRVQHMTTYLVDLQRQYADHEGGLGMIDVVLKSLVHRVGPRSELASERDPHPEY